MSEPAPLPSLADKLPQPKLVVLAISVVAVALSLFQMYGAGIEPLGLFYQRSIHLAFVMFLAFLMFPVFGSNRKRGVLGWVIDLGFLAGAFITGFYLSFYLDEIFNRAGFWTSTDLIIGIIATVTVLEASRRAVGLGMTVIGIVAIVYALSGPRGALPWLGEWLPGILSHRGADVDRLGSCSDLHLHVRPVWRIP